MLFLGGKIDCINYVLSEFLGFNPIFIDVSGIDAIGSGDVINGEWEVRMSPGTIPAQFGF